MTPTSPKLIDMAIPNDIRISALLCLKNFVLQIPIPYEQLRSIWDENSFVPATLRSIINDLENDSESISTLKFASQFLNFLHSTVTRNLPQMAGIHQFLDWNSMTQQLLQIISNKSIRDCSILKECATLLYVILAKQRKPQTFLQFKGLKLCFELIERIMDNDTFLTNSIKEEYQSMKCIDIVSSSFNHHQISQYTQQHLTSKLLECSMQSVRLSRQPIQYLREPLVANTIKELIHRCYQRPKQHTIPSSNGYTRKQSDHDIEQNKNKNATPTTDDNDTAMTDTDTNTNTNAMNEDNDDSNNNDDANRPRSRSISDIGDNVTQAPAAKRQKNKDTVYQTVLPIVPTPTENYGHEVYQITCKMISVCIQNGAGLGVGKIFHEHGITMEFTTSLTKVCYHPILSIYPYPYTLSYT